MKHGALWVITADLFAGIANMSINDTLQSISSIVAIISTLAYLYDRFKNKKAGR